LAEALAGTALASLKLDDCDLGASGVSVICEQLSQNPHQCQSLKALSFNHNTDLDNAAMTAIAELIKACPKLTMLSLVNCGIDDAMVTLLKDAIKGHAAEIKIDLGANPIGTDAFPALNEAVSGAQRMKMLIVDHPLSETERLAIQSMLGRQATAVPFKKDLVPPSEEPAS
jgi:Ran GTPase-activating protein (RanGAP) involved in mRNA processing and transport